MSLRPLSSLSYIPMISSRPAEMSALEELPNRDKDLLLPLVPIGTWSNANLLQSTLSRIQNAYGTRPFIADLSDDGPLTTRRKVHDELDELRDPTDGYANWCSFIESHANYIPVIRISRADEIRLQVRRLSALNRDLVLRIPSPILGRAPALVELIAQEVDTANLCVVLDYEKQNRELLNQQATAAGIIRSIRSYAPDCFISISASSFPNTFSGLPNQDIYEREFFNALAELFGKKNFIYSDRGSARAERQGGGGTPAPRVDYASSGNWDFFREEAETPEERLAAYQKMANAATNSDRWDPDLNLWGTQLIQRTASGDQTAINSPRASTAARINIHLHQQLMYGSPPQDVHDTDDDWID